MKKKYFIPAVMTLLAISGCSNPVTPVDQNLVNVTFQNDDKVTWEGNTQTKKGEQYQAKVTKLASGYTLTKENVTVKINDTPITKGWYFINNLLSIDAASVTGNISISQTPTKIESFIVTTNLSDLDSDYNIAKRGVDFVMDLVPKNDQGKHYRVPEKITQVKINGIEVESKTESPTGKYSYNKDTGKLTIAGKDVVGDIEITAEGILQRRVVLRGEGYEYNEETQEYDVVKGKFNNGSDTKEIYIDDVNSKGSIKTFEAYIAAHGELETPKTNVQGVIPGEESSSTPWYYVEEGKAPEECENVSPYNTFDKNVEVFPFYKHLQGTITPTSDTTETIEYNSGTKEEPVWTEIGSTTFPYGSSVQLRITAIGETVVPEKITVYSEREGTKRALEANEYEYKITQKDVTKPSQAELIINEVGGNITLSIPPVKVINVRFDANGGRWKNKSGELSVEALDLKKVPMNEKTLLQCLYDSQQDLDNLFPVKEEAGKQLVFAGWALDSAEGPMQDNNLVLTSNTTLYAKYIDVGDQSVRTVYNDSWTNFATNCLKLDTFKEVYKIDDLSSLLRDLEKEIAFRKVILQYNGKVYEYKVRIIDYQIVKKIDSEGKEVDAPRFTFEFVNTIAAATPYNSTSPNVSTHSNNWKFGDKYCDLKQFCDELYSKNESSESPISPENRHISKELKNAITQITKTTVCAKDDGTTFNDESTMGIFVLSKSEYGLDKTSTTEGKNMYWYNPNGSEYNKRLYKTNIIQDSTTDGTMLWTRSSDLSSTHSCYIVKTSSSRPNYLSTETASESLSIAPCFCI